jgi:hypothetical protein
MHHLQVYFRITGHTFLSFDENAVREQASPCE